MCHNCFMLNVESDLRIDEILADDPFNMMTVRQRFPSDTVYSVVYNSKGQKIHEGWEN